MSSNPSRTIAPFIAPHGTSQEFAEAEKPTLSLADTSVPPVARVVPRVETVHGERRVDDYFWLRDRSDPEVIAYLEAENRYTAASMRHTEALQERLYQEMRGRIKETDLSVPERIDDYLYYSRTEAGGQYPILCRRQTEAGAEEILLDQNPLAAGHKYFRIGVSEVSPDHRLLAYSVDISGSEEFTLFIKDLTTGSLLAESIANTSMGVAWANDSRTLLYTVLDKTRRPCRLYRHLIGTNPAEDVLVYFEPDASFFLDISRTRSRAYLLLDISSHSTSEVRFVSADRPEERFRGGTTPPGGGRVHRQPQWRPVLHHHQRCSSKLPPGPSPGRDAGEGALGSGVALPSRGQAGFDRRLSGSPRGL